MAPSTGRPGFWWSHVYVLAGYVLVAILFTWPLPRHLHTHLPGSPDGDTGVYVWNLWVFQHELLDQRALPYFTDRIFANGRASLGLHNYTLFADVIALPVIRVLGVVATFNLVYLLLTTLTGSAVFLLARHLTRDAWVSWLAGLLFAWSPVMVTRGMGHFSLVAAAPLAIFVLLLLRSSERPSVVNTIGLGVTVAWATACDVYYGVYCVMLVTAALGATWLRLTRSAGAPTARWLAVTRAIDLIAISVAGLVFSLLVSQGWAFTVMGRLIRVRSTYTPVLILTILLVIRLTMHYRPTLRTLPFNRMAASLRGLAMAGIVSALLLSPLIYAVTIRVLEDPADRTRIFWRSSPPGVDVLALLIPNPNHPLMPGAVGDAEARFTNDGYLENVASIPLIAIVTLIIAWRIGWRPPGFAVAIAIGFGLLALGPFVRVGGVDTHVPGPWAVIRYLPIVGLARSPSRFFIVAMLGIAVVYATALRAIVARWPRARVRWLVTATVLVAAELLPAPRVLFSAEIPWFYRIVADDPRADIRVLELPFGLRDGRMAVGNFTSRTQFHQTAHAKPIMGGYLSRVTRRRVRAAERDPVLGVFIKLSEGKELGALELELLRAEWPAFVRQKKIGYVVVDRERASAHLNAQIAVLRLETIAAAGSLTLFRPPPD